MLRPWPRDAQAIFFFMRIQIFESGVDFPGVSDAQA